MKPTESARGSRPRYVSAAAAALLMAALSLTAVIALQTQAQIRQGGRLRFERLAERTIAELERRINLTLYGLNGVAGLYAASRSVERDEFRTFVMRHDPVRDLHGVLGFGVIERVPRDAIASFAASQQPEEPGFRISTSGDHAYVYPMKYFEPPEAGIGLLGQDIGMDPVARAAVDRSIRTGEPTLAGPLRVADQGAPGSTFLYIMPIYRNGTDPRTDEERAESLVGLVCAPLLMEVVFDDLGETFGSMLDMDVFRGEVSYATRMIDVGDDERGLGTEIAAHYARRMFRKTEHVSISGQDWVVVLSSLPQFEATVDTVRGPLIAVAGTLISCLLAAMLWMLGTAHQRALVLAREMTADLEAARLRADAASHAKSVFLANMSHEIRTPLTSVLGYADLLCEEGERQWPLEQRLQTLQTVRSAGKHLLTVVNDILDFSKIEAGKATVESVETPLLQLLCEIESLMLPRALSKGLTLAVRLRTPLPDRVLCDPTRLRQILLNLTGNALKFTEIGGAMISARAEPRAGSSRLIIDVSDTGPGISAEQAKLLFLPFSQADASATRRFGGTGLGLAICRRFAELLGGTVTLAASEPGRGACFRLDLPLLPLPGAVLGTSLEGLMPEPGQIAQLPITLDGRVLLAEDGEDNRRLITLHLRKAGADVETAENGNVALAMIEKAEREGRPYDLLLTDIQMPELDGYTLARVLRGNGNRIPIVALTAHALAEDRVQCMKAGCDDYAAKPIDRRDLLQRCARWLGSTDGSE